jgi:predicted transcriptional regulator of viral defense system
MRREPDWNALNELALPQSGYFRAAQAATAGFSNQLLRKHVLSGRFSHEARGVYRLVNFPPGEYDELISLWLWSEELGVFSHETALALYQLSDALPSRVHMTMPRSWRKRSAVPPILMLHQADVPESDRAWIGPVPVTAPSRTLRDAVDAGVDPSLVSQAAAEGMARKLLVRADVRGIVPASRGRRVRKVGGSG